MIFIVKVTTNKEERVLDMIAERVQKKNLNVFSILRPHGLRGYILLEAEDRESAEEAAFDLPYVKGIIGKTLTYEEIKNMVETSSAPISIKEGDIVEIEIRKDTKSSGIERKETQKIIDSLEKKSVL